MRYPPDGEEFFRQYAERSGVTVEWLRENGREVFPCDCEENGCMGWQIRNKKDYYRDLKVFAMIDGGFDE